MISYVKAWEETEKANCNNRFERAIARIRAWETSKQSMVDANLSQAEQRLEKRRASVVENMKNESAEIHRIALEKVARAEARRNEELIAIEEESTRCQMEGRTPRSCLMPCFET
ncbi:hypothetical protein KP509_04G101900 [Ceratopteris richardii]|nr:hypothetical protein KP509_04G101900 [Ceratopteris richardii]